MHKKKEAVLYFNNPRPSYVISIHEEFLKKLNLSRSLFHERILLPIK